MATAIYRQNISHPTMHMLPMRMPPVAGPPAQQVVHQQHQLQQQQQLQHAMQQSQQQQQHHHHPYHQSASTAPPPNKRRAIAPASAQNPRTVAPLHPANGQHARPQPAPIQPKSSKPTTAAANPATRMPFTPYGVPTMPPMGSHHQPASVQRRNARERNRVKQVNNGFANLRQHIPGDVISALSAETGQTVGRGASKKLSKVDTLKLAVEYIRRMQELIDETDAASATGSSSSICSSSSNSSASSSSSFYSASSPTSSIALSVMPAAPTPSQLCDSQRSIASASPAPSLLSEVSSVYSTVHSTTGGGGPASSICSSGTSTRPDAAADVVAADANVTAVPYKYEPYDAAYNAEDEELLDCITWWQQQ